MEQLTNEQIIIGKVLDDNTLADVVFRQLSEEDFTEEPARETFKVMKSLHDSGTAIELDIVMGRLAKVSDEKGHTVDELNYIVPNMMYVQSPIQVFINEVLDESNTRKQRQTLRLIEKKLDHKQDYSDELEQLRQNQYSGDRFRIRTMAEVMDEVDAGISDSYNQQIPTGFTKLDDQLNGGLRRSWFYIIGARSGHGKTAFASTMFRSIVNAGKFPYYISLEMKRTDIASRMLFAEAGFPEKVVERNALKYAETLQTMKGWNALIDDQPKTISDIERASRYAVKRMGADVIFIDYIGLVQGESKYRSRIEEIAEYSRRLATLSKELDRPIVCLSQINRESDRRSPVSKDGYDFKIPTMIDLADSSSLEKDADCIIMLAVAEDEDGTRPLLNNGQNPAVIRIEKNRKGEKGRMIKLSFNGGITTFSEGGW